MIVSQRFSRGVGVHQSKHLLHVGDVAALAVATLVAEGFDFKNPLQMVILGLSGVTARQLLTERPFRARRLTSRTLLSPLLAAAITLLVLAAVREPYSGTELAVFVALWTSCMAAVRTTVWRITPPARVLLLGESDVYDDLLRRKDIDLHKLKRPPDTVLGWDIVAVDGLSPVSAEWAKWLAHADMARIPIVNAHTLSEELNGKIALSSLEERWASEVFQADPQYRAVKRMFDLVCVILLSPVLLPLCGLVTLLVLIDNGRPVLFFQERVGLGGKPYRMVKFRTMRPDAEAKGSAFASQNDPRVTRVGRFLRKFRLDELPQFWNVLKGEMSIIGPRPEQVPFVQKFEEQIPLYRLRHNVPPGITGWAQVKQGYAAGVDESIEKLRYDFWYIKNFSFWTDARVVLLTILTILTGFGSR